MTRVDTRWLSDELDSIEAHIWTALEQGRPFHWPSVSTIDPAWGPTSRVVVLRSVDRNARQLVFHTDMRSDKIEHLRADPRHAWHFFDSERVQLRARAVASLHSADVLADEAWASLSPGSQRTYCSSDPGARRVQAETGLPAGWFERELGVEEVAAGRAHFCAVVARVVELEFLYLGDRGHRRARFNYEGGARVTSTWLVP